MWLVCLPIPHQGPVNTTGLVGRKRSNAKGSFLCPRIWPFHSANPPTPLLLWYTAIELGKGVKLGGNKLRLQNVLYAKM